MADLFFRKRLKAKLSDLWLHRPGVGAPADPDARRGALIGAGVLSGLRQADVHVAGRLEGAGTLSGTSELLRAGEVSVNGALIGEGRLSGTSQLVDNRPPPPPVVEELPRGGFPRFLRKLRRRQPRKHIVTHSTASLVTRDAVTVQQRTDRVIIGSRSRSTVIEPAIAVSRTRVTARGGGVVTMAAAPIRAAAGGDSRGGVVRRDGQEIEALLLELL